MTSDRGSNYNAFTLFLIFILLYLAQKGVNASASAYSESGSGETNQPEQPEVQFEKQVAVGLSNGDVVDYTQELADQTEESDEEKAVWTEDATEEAVVEEPEVIEVEEPEVIELEEPEAVLEEQKESLGESEEVAEEELIQVPEATGELIQEGMPEDDMIEPIEQEVITDQPFTETESIEEVIQEDLPEDDQEIHELDSAMEEEPNQVDDLDNQVTDEPVLGGQSNLFLKPTVMTGVHVKKEHSGPKISFKYGN